MLKRVSRNFAYRFLQMAIRESALFAFTMITAKVLDPVSFGSYSYILSIVYLFVAFCDFGVSAATFNAIARHRARDEKNIQPINELILRSILLSVILSFLASIVLVFLDITGEVEVAVLLPIIFFAPLVAIFDGYFRAMNLFKRLFVANLFSSVVCVAICFSMTVAMGISGALLTQGLFAAVVFVVLAIKSGLNFRVKKLAVVEKKFLIEAAYIGVASLGYLLYSRFNIVLLGHTGNLEEAGHYEILNKFFQLSIFPFVVAGFVLAPEIPKLYANNKEKFRKLIKKSAYWLVALAGGLGLISFFLLPVVVGYFFPSYRGEGFVSIARIFSLIVPFACVETIFSLAVVIPLGGAKISSAIMIVGGAANVVMGVAAIYLFGPFAMIAVTVGVYCLVNITKIIYFYYKYQKVTL